MRKADWILEQSNNEHVRLGIDQRLADTGRLRDVYVWPPLAYHGKTSPS